MWQIAGKDPLRCNSKGITPPGTIGRITPPRSRARRITPTIDVGRSHQPLDGLAYFYAFMVAEPLLPCHTRHIAYERCTFRCPDDTTIAVLPKREYSIGVPASFALPHARGEGLSCIWCMVLARQRRDYPGASLIVSKET